MRAAELGAEAGVLHGICILLGPTACSEVVRIEQLARAELSAVHKPGWLFRPRLEYASAPISA